MAGILSGGVLHVEVGQSGAVKLEANCIGT